MARKAAKPRKRAPGAGRPPKGEFAVMTEGLSIRIPVETRRRLEEVAGRNGRSLTQEVVRRLEDSMAAPPHIQALGKMIMDMALAAEVSAQKRWVDDPFTSSAVASAVQGFVYRIRPWRLPPDKPDAVPKALEAKAKSAEGSHPGSNIAEQYRTAWGLGTSVMEGALLKLITSISQQEAAMREALHLVQVNALAGPVVALGRNIRKP